MLAKFGKKIREKIYISLIFFKNKIWLFFFSAADRSVTDSVADAKEGLVVSCVDTIETYRQQVMFFKFIF